MASTQKAKILDELAVTAQMLDQRRSPSAEAENVEMLAPTLIESEGEAEAPERDSTPVILVVDDRPTGRMLVRSVLEGAGYVALEAAGGTEALELIERRSFDLILLDVMMPDINGMEVLKRIRERYSEIELPVIMLTMLDESSDVVEALERGANDYVTKPIEFPVLQARIKTHLHRKKAEDGLVRARDELEIKVRDRTAELVEANRILRDEVREREEAEKALKRNREILRLSEVRYRTFYDDTPSMFFTVDLDGSVLSVNRFGAEYLGYEIEDLVGRDAIECYCSTQSEMLAEHLADIRDCAGQVRRKEFLMQRRDGERIWVRQTGRIVPRPDGTDAILLVCEDVSETHRLSEQLVYQATHDSLTNLVNRRELDARVRTALESAHLDDDRHALCYLDLDQFKVINDTKGHIVGDKFLRHLGQALNKIVRSSDTLARLGGDEFAVLLVRCPLAQAQRVADKLRKAVEEFRFELDGATHHSTVSVGLVTIDSTTRSADDIMSAADAACYAAKDAGGNRVYVFQRDDEVVNRHYNEMEWVPRIKHALDSNRFTLFAQPLLHIGPSEQDCLPGVEFLLRMTGDDGLEASHADFLLAAERYNLASSIDRWVVSSAFELISSLAGTNDQASRYSINLSGHSLGDDGLLPYVLNQLDAYDITPEIICFEVTETAAIENLAQATRFFNGVRERGCRIALDDFGSGFCSFAYLNSIPVDFLKIDGQFIRDISNDPVNLAIVHSIIDLATTLGKRTVAEFVDSDQTLRKLRELGVDYAQGNHISPPKAIVELELSSLSERFRSVLLT